MGVEVVPVYAAVAAWCVALCHLLRWVGTYRIDRVRAAMRPADGGVRPSDALMLQMLAVALRGGASIPYALEAVGTAVGGPQGRVVCAVSSALCRGVAWRDAWLVDGDDCPPVCVLIAEGLRDAWEHGSSPVQGLQLAVERADRDADHAMREGAAALSVKILLPMGLCFLPAFVATGVVPTAMSLMAG